MRFVSLFGALCISFIYVKVLKANRIHRQRHQKFSREDILNKVMPADLYRGLDGYFLFLSPYGPIHKPLNSC